MIALYILASVALLISALLLSSVKIEIYFNLKQRVGYAHIYIAGIRLKPKKKKKKTKAAITKDVLLDTARKMKIKRLELFVLLGTGEAAATVWALGALQVVVCGVVAVFWHNIQKKKLRLRFVPEFERMALQVEFSCIITAKIAHIIFSFVRSWIKGKSNKGKDRIRNGKTDSDDVGDHPSKSA